MLPFHHSVFQPMMGQIFSELFAHHGFEIGQVANVHLDHPRGNVK